MLAIKHVPKSFEYYQNWTLIHNMNNINLKNLNTYLLNVKSSFLLPYINDNCLQTIFYVAFLF